MAILPRVLMALLQLTLRSAANLERSEKFAWQQRLVMPALSFLRLFKHQFTNPPN